MCPGETSTKLPAVSSNGALGYNLANLFIFTGAFHNDDLVTRHVASGATMTHIKKTVLAGDRRLAMREMPGQRPSLIEICSAEEGYGLYCHTIPSTSMRCRVVRLVHKCCLGAAMQVQQERKFSLLIRLSKFIPPVDPAAGKKGLVFRPRWGKLNLTTLLARVSRLPHELQNCVVSHLDNTVVGSLFKTHRAVLELLPKTDQLDAPTWPRQSWCGAPADWSGVYVRTSSALGRPYVTSVKIDEALARSALNAEGKQFQGFQCAVSTFGLRAIRILLTNDSPSPWFGDPSECWLGILPIGNWRKLIWYTDVSAENKRDMPLFLQSVVFAITHLPIR
jgi:hypothetical protein